MSDTPISAVSRRHFMRQIAVGGAFAALADWRAVGASTADSVTTTTTPFAATGVPWFQRTLRWGQTNLTEMDSTRIDIAWWRAHWKRTAVQGVVLNAGGIVAYYPTHVPYHRRAEFLGDRDLFGELRQVAREDGLAVFARMDSNRAGEDLFRAHPDWFARDASGQPYKVTDLYVACVNSPYYEEHIPAILSEIATRYQPEGFTDNNWNGPMRHQPCFCANCERVFGARTGERIPRTADWNSPVYREWIMWNYERRLEIWDKFNQVTRTAGGPECIWVGMMAGAQNWQSRVFRDDREVYRRTEMIMLDDQRRFDDEGFQHNGEIGKRIRGVAGWDKVIPESMAMYQLADRNFRLAAKPVPEVRMWVVEGFAGGVQPWWHHVGSEQYDRRALQTATPLWQWHREHEEFLINRRPVATVGLLWSQRNMDFFGRDAGAQHVDDPWNGFTQALVRARIPYVPVHLDDLEREVAELGLRVLILPNLGAMSDAQVAAVKRFVAAGGSLLATGLSSLFNEWGDIRPDFALADVFGVHLPDGHGARNEETRGKWAASWNQTYLRLVPELRAGVDGPNSGNEPAVSSERHPVLDGFAETDILAFGGILEPLEVDDGAIVPLTFVPPVPLSPPESVWMRELATQIPGLVLRETGQSRVAFLAADLDRRFAREYLPDQGDLLANIVRWTLKDDVPVRVEGAGLIDCHLYRQPGRVVLHLINLTSAGTWRTPVHELIPVGPFKVAIRQTEGLRGSTLRSLVSNERMNPVVRDGWIHFEVPSILDHEVFVIG